MDDYFSNLITNSADFIGGRTLVPGPIEVPLRGTMISSTSFGSSYSQNRHPLVQVQVPTHSQFQGNAIASKDYQQEPANAVGTMDKENSTSILRVDVPAIMLSWMRTQNEMEDSQNFMFSQPVEAHPSASAGSGRETFEVETPRIPKPYIELTPRDCTGVVARAIRSIILHTCNDDFRQQVFAKLGVSSSHEVERQIKARLCDLITQDEQRRHALNDTTDTENSQQSQAST